MTAHLILDITRSLTRRLKGEGPTGIDRVCDAYALHYAANSRVAVQILGRILVFGPVPSRRLFRAMGRSRLVVVLELARALFGKLFSRRPGVMASPAIYLNVGHTSFDRPAHWRSIARLGVAPVYMVHDLIPVAYPHLTTPKKTARHMGRVYNALSGAAGIIANSRSTAQQVLGFASVQDLPVPPVLAAPLGLTQTPEQRWRGGDEAPYFLSVGTIEPRKNQAFLLDLWSRLYASLGARTPKLVIAGRPGLRAKALIERLKRDPQLQHCVELRAGLSDAEIEQLMLGARAMLLPSLAEGCGLPLVEALAVGLPVIASVLPSFREMGQGCAELLALDDLQAWEAAVLARVEPQHIADQEEASGFVPWLWQDHFRLVDEWLGALQERLFTDAMRSYEDAGEHAEPENASQAVLLKQDGAHSANGLQHKGPYLQ